MPLKTVLEQPEHEFEDDDWEDEDELGADGDELIEIDELDEGFEDEDEDI
jgi:hypothetical protein